MCVCAVAVAWCSPAAAQIGGSLDVPQTRLAPSGQSLGIGGLPASPPYAVGGPITGPASSGSLFDPYSGGPAGGYVSPAQSPSGFFGAPATVAPQGGLFGTIAPSPIGAPAFGGGGFGAPGFGGSVNQPPPLFGSTPILGGSATAIPSTGFGGPVLNSPGAYGAPTGYGYAPSAFPSGAPSTLFPGGLFGNASSFSPNFNPYRLIQRARFRHTFLFGNEDPDALQVNDTDVAFAFAFPRFFASTQPLFITPSFSLHQWDGPLASTGADLPGNAYSAFVDFAWASDPNRIVGAELGASVGSYSEFDVFRSDSLRVRGKGLGTFRLTPATTFKLGVYYYDRVKIKLLPAGGLLWRPNPFTKVDLFFPQPKISRFVSTVGTNDVWWYLSGDYGGGSWTIDRDDGRSDQVDYNDIRLMMGFEWGTTPQLRAGSRTAFFEFGYVADRELVYRNNPQDDIGLDDTWMIRLGLGY